jgi:adenine-specific DNA-methyltransferase
MDFFAGSGTTGQAILNLNHEDKASRKFILVQLPQPLDENSEAYKKGYRKISDVCLQRVKRTIEQIGVKLSAQFKLEETPYGLNFKAFQLTSSNFKLWDASAGSKDADGLAKQLELYADNLLPGRSQDDILYEVILKAGQPLTAKIEKIEIAEQQVFSIDGGAMLICLEDPIKEETLVGMLEYQPAVMVALDKAFHGNDQLKTNIKLQAEATGESEQSRVLFKTV